MVAQACAQAEALLWQMLNTQLWVDRRTEAIEPIAGPAIRRTTSTQLFVPAVAPLIKVDEATSRLVLVTWTRKRKRIGFEVTDEAGRVVAHLTSDEARPIVRSVIEWLLRSVLDIGTDTSEQAVDQILSVFESTEDKATKQEREAGMRATIHSAFRALDEAATPLTEHAHAILSEARCTDAKMYAALETLVRRAAYNLPLMVLLPDPAGTQRTITVTQIEPSKVTLLGESLVRRVAIALGWTSFALIVPIPAAVEARRFHLDLKAPSGLQLLIGRIVSLGALHDDLGDLHHGGGIALRRLDREPTSPDEIPDDHIRLNTAVNDRTVRKLYGIFHLQVARRGWLNDAVAINAGITLILASVTRFATLPSATSPSPVVLLLSILSLAAAVLVRADEHELAGQMLRTLRRIVIAGCITPMVAALALVLPGRPSIDRMILASLTVGSGLITLVLVITWLRCRRPTAEELQLRVSPEEGATPWERARHRRVMASARSRLAIRYRAPHRDPGGTPTTRVCHREAPYGVDTDWLVVDPDTRFNGIVVGTTEGDRFRLRDEWDERALTSFRQMVSEALQAPG